MSTHNPPSVAHAGFTLVRDYPVARQHLWDSFARENQKRAWFGDDPSWTAGEWRFDFRVGGVDVAEGQFHGGPHSRYEAVYTDIVTLERIVLTYNMWIDGTHISTSVVSNEFDDTREGSRLTHGEHGVHLDGFDDGALRESGTAEILDKFGRYLTR